MKVIIDCDPGIDDAYALAIACLIENINILALTIVHGNTDVYSCALNAKLINEKVFPSNVNPEIYIGAANPILFNTNDNLQNEILRHFYGKDGLGGTTLDLYKNEVDRIKETFLKQKMNNGTHAALKILELVNQYPNEVTIIAIGPLTNLALAYRMTNEPEKFTRNIKQLYIMGGNEPNQFSHYHHFSLNCPNNPEFNFALDPIAAKLVIDQFKCPIRIFTFDSCLRTFRYETKAIIQLFDKYIGKSKRCSFIERIGIIHRLSVPWKEYFALCDLATMIGIFYGDRCDIVYKRLVNHTIEVNSAQLNGVFRKLKETEEPVNKEQNIELCLTFDNEKAFEIFEEVLIKLTKLDEN